MPEMSPYIKHSFEMRISFAIFHTSQAVTFTVADRSLLFYIAHTLPYA
jgi:hypothetical protein